MKKQIIISVILGLIFTYLMGLFFHLDLNAWSKFILKGDSGIGFRIGAFVGVIVSPLYLYGVYYSVKMDFKIAIFSNIITAAAFLFMVFMIQMNLDVKPAISELMLRNQTGINSRCTMFLTFTMLYGMSYFIIYMIRHDDCEINEPKKIKPKNYRKLTYAKDYDGIKHCSRCGEEIHESYTGEGGVGGKKWRYWHSECYDIKFCEDMRSSPAALAKYYQIYGMSPEDKIINGK